MDDGCGEYDARPAVSVGMDYIGKVHGVWPAGILSRELFEHYVVEIDYGVGGRDERAERDRDQYRNSHASIVRAAAPRHPGVPLRLGPPLFRPVRVRPALP